LWWLEGLIIKLRGGRALAEDKLNALDPLRANTCAGFESLRLRSLHGFPTLRQHIECQCVTVGVLVAFQYGHWR